MIAVGAFQLAEGRPSAAGPLIVIAVGTVLLAFTTGFLDNDAWDYVWPIAIIVVGLALLLRSGLSLPRGAGPDEELLRASGIFSGPEVASASQSFRGASLTAVFGGVTLDLR